MMKAISEAWEGVEDDYRQTFNWLRHPTTTPPTGAFYVFGSWGMVLLIYYLW